jgi:hypothetical protein
VRRAPASLAAPCRPAALLGQVATSSCARSLLKLPPCRGSSQLHSRVPCAGSNGGGGGGRAGARRAPPPRAAALDSGLIILGTRDQAGLQESACAAPLAAHVHDERLCRRLLGSVAGVGHRGDRQRKAAQPAPAGRQQVARQQRPAAVTLRSATGEQSAPLQGNPKLVCAPGLTSGRG